MDKLEKVINTTLVVGSVLCGALMVIVILINVIL